MTEAAGQNESVCRYLLLLLIHLLRLSSPLAASVSVARAAGDFCCLRPPRVCCCCFRRLCFPVLKVSLLAALYLRRKQPAALVARAATDTHTCARRALSTATQVEPRAPHIVTVQSGLQKAHTSSPGWTCPSAEKQFACRGHTGSNSRSYLGTFCTEILDNVFFRFTPNK